MVVMKQSFYGKILLALAENRNRKRSQYMPYEKTHISKLDHKKIEMTKKSCLAKNLCHDAAITFKK